MRLLNSEKERRNKQRGKEEMEGGEREEGRIEGRKEGR